MDCVIDEHGRHCEQESIPNAVSHEHLRYPVRHAHPFSRPNAIERGYHHRYQKQRYGDAAIREGCAMLQEDPYDNQRGDPDK